MNGSKLILLSLCLLAGCSDPKKAEVPQVTKTPWPRAWIPPEAPASSLVGKRVDSTLPALEALASRPVEKKPRPTGRGSVWLKDEASPCCAYWRKIVVRYCDECRPNEYTRSFSIEDPTDEEWAEVKMDDCYLDGKFYKCPERKK